MKLLTYFLTYLFLAASVPLFASTPKVLAQGLKKVSTDIRLHNGKSPSQEYCDVVVGEVFGYIPRTYEPVKNGTQLSLSLTREGKLKDLKLRKQSESFEDTFNCLVGITMAFQFTPPPRQLGDKELTFGIMNANVVVASPDSKEQLRILNSFERRKFLRSCSYPPETIVLLNSMPLVILEKYPTLFTPAELCAAENLRAIERTKFSNDGKTPDAQKILTNKSLKLISDSWNEFFQNHNNPSREEVLAFRSIIDNRASGFFTKVAGATP